MLQPLLDYYRIAEEAVRSVRFATQTATGDVGFFRFGSQIICYGRCSSGVASDCEGSAKFNVGNGVHGAGPVIQLPFDPAEVIENLRLERYQQQRSGGLQRFASSEPARKSYYFFRRCLPFPIRRQLQRIYFQDWDTISFPAWPVDFTVDALHEKFLRLLMEASGVKRVPFIWFWPEGAPNCLIMTHDVETSVGRDFTSQLMDLDESYGIRASFQVIPEERYELTDAYVSEIRSRGFEFNIHDLNHDGHLYRQRHEFARRAAKINRYVHRYGARGFRAGSMYRRQDWYDVFEFSYDMSVPNVAHLEPMRGGCCTVMPYFVGKIVELPVMAVQDYSLFHILNDYSIDLWAQQLDLIRVRKGLMSFIVHPDYMIEPRARKVYETLLDHLRQMVLREKIWAALPGELDTWWRARSQMKLVSRANEWEIVGPGKERARLAYAILDGGRLLYEVAERARSSS